MSAAAKGGTHLRPDPEAKLARENPPGQRQLHFRAGTYRSFLQHMLTRLPRHVVVVDGVATRPLEMLDPASSRDFSAALLDAWATVGDVLTFYQERLLNEGFLRTAVEPRSVRELTSQLGFPLRPGVAASTWLGFSVTGAPGAQDGIRVSTGTAAQSIPGTGETPQTFETAAAIVARPAWNSVAPAPAFTTVAQSLAVSDAQARLAGTGTGLGVGAPLLAAAADGSAWSFGAVTSVEPSAQARETRVTWSPAAAGTRGAGTMAGPAVFGFGRTTRLFGYNAAAWSALTTEQKRAQREILGGVFVLAGPGGDWVGASGGLPATDVRTLAVDETGRVYAGTAGAGIYVSADAGLTWSAAGPRYGDVYAIAPGTPGRVYAGMAGGRVYRSCDGGGSWDSVSGGTTVSTGKKDRATVVVTRLPAAPVRALFDDGAGTLYAGTDFGAYRSNDAVPGWSAVTLDSGDVKYEHDEAAAAASPPAAGPVPAVWCFARTPWEGVTAMGTDAGVWSLEHGQIVGHGLPAATDDGQPNVVRALIADGSALLAGTDAGLFAVHRLSVVRRLLDEHGEWRAASGPESGGLPLPVRALVDTPLGLLAATPQGVFRRDPRGAWARVGTEGMPAGSPPCASPPCPPGDCGSPIPVPAPPGLNQPDVTTLAAGSGLVVAASPYAGFPVEEWPGPPVCDHVIYLSGVIPQVVPGSWIVLQQASDAAGGGPAPAVAVARVAAARTLMLERYARRGQATEVRVEPVPGLEVFDLRATSVYAASRALGLVSARLADLVPFAGTRLKLAGALPALEPGRAVSVNGKRIRAAVWPRAGVFVSGKKGWTTAGLASVDVAAVAWGPGGTMLAAVGGTPGDAGPAAGLYASKDGGATWLPASGALAGVRVHALAAGGGAAWAAGPHGAVFTSADGVAWSAAGTAGKAVTALAVSPAGAVYAATADAGVLRRGTDGGWTQAGTGLPTGSVRALAISGEGGVAAATVHGVGWLAAGAAAWTGWNTGLANLDVRAIAALPGGEVLAGTGGGGVFSAPAPLDDWEAASGGLDAPGARTITMLAADTAGGAWVGTRGAGCWSRGAGETAWTAVALGAANDVRALAAGAGGVVAGCGGVPLLVSDADGLIRASLALESLLSLPASYAADLDRGSVSTALLKALTDAGVTFSPTSPPLVRVQTAGQAWWMDATDGVLLLRLDAGAVRVRRPKGLATLLGPPPSTPAGVPVADAGGNGGTLTPRAGELLWQPAAADAASLGEVGTVAGSAATGLKTTLLALEAPLANAYDPGTVKVCGNLAPATQGATQGAWPRPEVLGSGNASTPGQSFRLARAPLTFVETTAGLVSTLKVWVNGVEWTEVDTLYGQPPDAAAFAVRVDETGAATVYFGDGMNGARLPTGVGNVTAQYRVGIGASGNLATGRVTILRSVPLGVRAATNPVAAGGGAQGETTAEAAATAPLRARILERVVGLQDFRDYALAYSGISKAVAQPLRDRRGRRVVAVTVAGGRGGPEVPDPGLLDDLATSMLAAGAQGRFQVLACEPLALVVRARVECDPRYHAQAVALAASAALRAEYAPDRRVLGDGAAASRAVAVLQGVPGVWGVELLAFHLAGATPAVCNYVDALPARMDPRGDDVLAAQLLLPASPGGIVVTAQEAA